MHKYDQGAYTVLLFDNIGRKTGEAQAKTLVEADEIGDAHDGTYVVIRCLKNSADSSAPWMPNK